MAVDIKGVGVGKPLIAGGVLSGPGPDAESADHLLDLRSHDPVEGRVGGERPRG